MEDTVEGAAEKMGASPISPVQIAKKAEKQMRRNKMVGAGKQYAPDAVHRAGQPGRRRAPVRLLPHACRGNRDLPRRESRGIGLGHGRSTSREVHRRRRPEAREVRGHRRNGGRPHDRAAAPGGDGALRHRSAAGRLCQPRASEPPSRAATRARRVRPYAPQPRDERYGYDAGYGEEVVHQHPHMGIDAAAAASIGAAERREGAAEDFDDFSAQEPKTMVFGQAAAPRRRAAQAQDLQAYLYDVTNDRAFTLTGHPMSIGRESRNDVVVPDINASRAHAEIRMEPSGTWILSDLGSTNGTIVNGRKIKSAPLQDADRIIIGTTELEFQLL